MKEAVKNIKEETIELYGVEKLKSTKRLKRIECLEIIRNSNNSTFFSGGYSSKAFIDLFQKGKGTIIPVATLRGLAVVQGYTNTTVELLIYNEERNSFEALGLSLKLEDVDTALLKLLANAVTVNDFSNIELWKYNISGRTLKASVDQIKEEVKKVEAEFINFHLGNVIETYNNKGSINYPDFTVLAEALGDVKIISELYKTFLNKEPLNFVHVRDLEAEVKKHIEELNK